MDYNYINKATIIIIIIIIIISICNHMRPSTIKD